MGTIAAIANAIAAVFSLIGGVFKRKNDPDMIAAKDASNKQKIEEDAAKQAKQEGDSGRDIPIT